MRQEDRDRERLAGIDASAVERALAAPFLGRPFPPAIEALLEAETEHYRARQLLGAGLIGIAIFLTYLWVDWALTPDVLHIAFAVRLVVMLPLGIGLCLVLLTAPPPWLRETVAAALPVLATLSTLIVVLASEAPLRTVHLHSIVVALLFLAVVQRLRFYYAVVAGLLIFALYGIAMLFLGDGDLHDPAAVETVLIGLALVLSLFATFELEREWRRGYLLNVTLRLRGRSLEAASLHDPLTGLENRRALDLALSDIVGAGRAESVSLVLFDIDLFKTYNDTLGHQAGDECLKCIADVALLNARGPDRVFRYGGEEFLLLLRRTGMADALLVAERLRRAVEASGLVHPDREGGVVTASFGTASGQLASSEDAADLLLAADQALYRAKHAGRNRVWPPPPEAVMRLAGWDRPGLAAGGTFSARRP